MRALIVVMALARVAWAADADVERAHVHTQSGIEYYNEARYEEAAREFDAAYRLKALPELQYNLAQCYERMGKPDDAAQAYQKYLDGKPGSPDRDVVLKRMENLRARKEPAAKEKVVLKTIVVYRDLPPPPGRTARYAAYGIGVVALGALAGGIATAVLAKQAADDVKSGANTANPPTFDGAPRDSQSAGRTYVIASGVCFGVAAVGAAGAIALWFQGRKIDREAKTFTLAPSISPSGGALFASGRF
jgi:tetratricopeptide (TPR) repeat protein